MSEYTFTYIVSGLDAHDEDFADRLFEAGCSDATIMLVNGLVAVCFARDAESYAHAVVSAHNELITTGGRIERFEPDFLVSKAEIAKRAGLTRAAIGHYVSGERGKAFPPPLARVMSSSPLWDWVEVSAWLHEKGDVSREEVVNARISRVINWTVQRTGAALRDSDLDILKAMKGVRAVSPAA